MILEPRPYLERNLRIAEACDVLVAAPGEVVERLRSGTWATVRYARRRGSTILVVGPDGGVLTEQGTGQQLRLWL